MPHNNLIILCFIWAICIQSRQAYSSTTANVKSWAALSAGDKVAIVAPSRGASPEVLAKAKELLLSIGFEPVVDDCTFGDNTFNYANTDKKRAECFNKAMINGNIKALFAIRGGQGACDVVFRLEKYFSKDMEESWQPKPIIGFSDTTALHLLLNSRGIPSIHGPVLSLNKEAGTKLNGEQAFSQIADFLLHPNDQTLYDPQSDVHFTALNEVASSLSDKIFGVLTGGNLTGVATTIGTASEIPANSILILEDVGETPERAKRSLWQIQRGLLKRNKQPKAMILGDFKSDNPDFIQALREFASEVPYPVVKTDSIGHGKQNIFLAFGVEAVLDFGSVISLGIPSWNGSKESPDDQHLDKEEL